MISPDVSPSLFLISLLGALGGAAFCLLLLWMLRQQKFLHELFLAVRDIEQRNREAQRDLFLILTSYLGLRGMPHNGQPGPGRENRPLQGHKASETKQAAYGLTVDEVRLLMAVAAGEEPEPKSLSAILKSVKGLNNLEAKLRSLRDKEFIFYSDLSDVVTILPKGHHYLGLLRS